MVAFGSIVEIKFEYYVYLAELNQTLYLAKILDKATSEQCLQIRQKNEASAIEGRISAQKRLQNSVALSFVCLRTDEVRGRVAYTGKLGTNAEQVIPFPVVCVLNNQDMRNIRDEIINGSQYIQELRIHLRQIVLD